MTWTLHYFVVQEGDEFLLVKAREYAQRGHNSQVVARFKDEGECYLLLKLANDRLSERRGVRP